MPKSKKKYKTVKQYAEALLLRVVYVDVYSHNVGLDYERILQFLKMRFPSSGTTRKELQKTAYNLNSITPLPARRRSRRILARDYMRALLLHRREDGTGQPYHEILGSVKRVYPEVKPFSIKQVERYLTLTGFSVPPRGP